MADNTQDWLHTYGANTYQDDLTSSQSAIQYTTFQSTGVHHYYHNSVSTSESQSPGYQSMASEEQIFSETEIKALFVDRKRYLAHSFITSGIPLPQILTDRKDNEGGVTETVVTKEVEKTTSIATITTKKCCSAHGQGCSIDHGQTLYGTALTRDSGRLVQLPLIEDTGSGPNWLPHSIARTLECELIDAGPNAAWTDLAGHRYVAKKKTTISLDGIKDRIEEVEFYISPDRSPLQCAILGRNFIEKAGHPYEWFPDKPDTVGILVQSKSTLSERQTIQISRAEADKKTAELNKNRERKSKRGSKLKRSSTESSTATSLKKD